MKLKTKIIIIIFLALLLGNDFWQYSVRIRGTIHPSAIIFLYYEYLFLLWNSFWDPDWLSKNESIQTFRKIHCIPGWHIFLTLLVQKRIFYGGKRKQTTILWISNEKKVNINEFLHSTIDFYYISHHPPHAGFYRSIVVNSSIWQKTT